MNTLVTSIRFEGSGFPCTDEHRRIQEWSVLAMAKLGMRVIHLNRLGKIYAKDIANELRNHEVGAKFSPDIILTEPVLKVFDFIRSFKEPAAAVSHQYVFKQEDYPNLDKAEIPPYYGIPCFIGNKFFWEHWHSVVHPDLCNFAPPEDNYLLSFMNQYYEKTSFNFTSLRCLFHPEHGGRMPDICSLNAGVIMEDKYCGIPNNDIKNYI